jgi:hypothetical protein
MYRSDVNLLACLFVVMVSGFNSLSQTIHLSHPFSETDQKSNYMILGSNDDHVYVLATRPAGFPRIITLNHQLEILNSDEYPELSNSALLSFLPEKKKATLLFENFNDGYRKYKILDLSEGNHLSKEILRLPSDGGLPWEVISSPSGNHLLLYAISDLAADSVRLSMILINKDFEVADGKHLSFYLDNQFDQMGNVFIDDDGGIYSMIFDKPRNYRLGSRLRLYKFYSSTGVMAKKEIYLKEKKTVDLHLAFHPVKKQAVLHSLYYDFYTKDVNGIMTMLIDEKLAAVSPPVFFEFDKEFKKQLNTYNSGISSSDLMNYLKVYSTSVSDSGVFFSNAIIEADRIQTPNTVLPQQANRSSGSLMENDPLMGMLQRETLIRREMGFGATRGRRALAGSGIGAATSYSEAYINVMNQRPDLFFMPRDSSLNTKNNSPFFKKKIYDRQVFFSFDKNGKIKWHRWFETEDQSLLKKNPLYPAETANSMISIYYRHNSKEKAELAITRVNKADGKLVDAVLNIPSHISLLTTSATCKLGTDNIAILYFDNRTNKAGLGKVKW